MLYASQLDSRFLSFEMEGLEINFVNKDGTLWFTKKELSKIFEVTKFEIKDKLSDISYDQISFAGKEKKYYSLNKVVVLGYRLQKYKQTKVLNLLNMYVKAKLIDKTFINKVNTSISSNLNVLSQVVSI